jgi:hypothetical protein
MALRGHQHLKERLDMAKRDAERDSLTVAHNLAQARAFDRLSGDPHHARVRSPGKCCGHVRIAEADERLDVLEEPRLVDPLSARGSALQNCLYSAGPFLGRVDLEIIAPFQERNHRVFPDELARR